MYASQRSKPRSKYGEAGPRVNSYDKHHGQYGPVSSGQQTSRGTISDAAANTKLVPFLLASAFQIRSSDFTCDIKSIMPYLKKDYLRLPPMESDIPSRNIVLRTTDNSLAICALSFPLDSLADRSRTLGEVLEGPLKAKYGQAFADNGVELDATTLDGLFWNESNARGHRSASRYKLTSRPIDAETRDFLTNPPPDALLIVAIKGGLASNQRIDATQQDYINAVMNNQRAAKRLAEPEEDITRLTGDVIVAELEIDLERSLRLDADAKLAQAGKELSEAAQNLEKARAKVADTEDLEATCKQYEEERDLALQDLADTEFKLKNVLDLFPNRKVFARLFGHDIKN